MFKLLLENCIGKQGQNYKCWICHCMLPLNNFEIIEKHIQEDCHRSIADKRAWDKIPERKNVQKLRLLSEEECKELVENSIIFNIKQYYCNLCRCNLSITEEHIGGKAHKLRYGHQNKYTKPKLLDKNLTIEKQKDNLKPTVQDNIQYLSKSISLRLHHIKFVQSTNSYVCEICDSSLPEISNIFIHIEENFHKYNLVKQKVIPVTMLHKINCDVYCKKCDVLLNNNQTMLQCHCLLHLQKEQPNIIQDIVKFQFNHDNKIKISCLLCDVTELDDRTIAAHLDGQSHFDRFKLWKRATQKNNRQKNSDSNDQKIKLEWELDEHRFYPPEDFEIHMKNDKNNILVNLEDYDKFYKCFLCNKSFDSIFMLIQHYNESFTHNRKLKKFYSIYNSLNKNNDLLEYFNDNIKNSSNSSNIIDFAENTASNLTNIVQAKSTDRPKETHKTTNKVVNRKEKRQKKERQPRTKRNQLLYNKDLLDIGDKYILMCLEPGSENIFNINSNTIHELEFGTSLMVLNKCDRICIPCSYKIPSSFYCLCEHLQDEIHIQNLHEMLESSKDFDDYELSYLDLAKSYMQEEQNDQVKCFACKESLPNFDDEIQYHINLATHISKVQFLKQDYHIINQNLSVFLKDLWYYVDKFSCKLCNVIFNREINFIKHFEEAIHLLNAQVKTQEDNKMNICLGCCSCWFGKSNYGQHYTEPIHLQTLKRLTAVLPQIPKIVITHLKNFDEIVKNLIKESNEMVDNYQYKEQKLLESAEDTVKPVYPNAKAYAFGSRQSYLGFANSDVDVFIDCENKYFEIGSKEASQAYIQNTRNQFCKKNAHIWKKEIILLNPRVPIIKLEHKKTQLKCDISFLSGLGVEKSKLIRNYVIAYEHCRKLILYLKQWFCKCELYGPHAVNAYAISWYAIFYLQVKGIFPSVKKLIELKNQSKIVDGWQCGFLETIPVTMTNYSFEDILQGFFSYYAEFNYCTDVVSPLLGKVLKKKSFINFDELPEAMEIYKRRIQTEEMEFFRYDSPMCIQDPVDLTQNITKAVSKVQLRYFRSYCAQSLQILLE